MDLLTERLNKWERELRTLHEASQATARSDPQKAGHTTEGIWVRIAQQMLPPSYRVLSRRYMETEVDIVILPPSAPSFYDEADVTDIPLSVASAVIHVKSTLDKGELRDTMRRIHTANSGGPEYRSTAERERFGLPSAIVALGTRWQGGFEAFHQAFSDILEEELPPVHPGQIPGFVGTPDWDMNNLTIDFGRLPEKFLQDYQKADARWREPHVVKMVAGASSGLPVHSFIQWLYTACSASDASLEPMRVALTQIFALSGTSSIWPFERNMVYSESRRDR